MEKRELNSWVEFKGVVDEIRKTYGYYDRDNVVLFRGQPDLPLKTTLERKSTKEFTLGYYLALAGMTVNEIESNTGTKWDIPDHPDLMDEIKNKQSWHRVYLPQVCYSYLVYLRHHGYPSPLLDWTTSPYIAAYFALCDVSKDENVAVYVYVNLVGNVKSLENPLITLFGQYVSTHKRHFAQKAMYTIASKWSEDSSSHSFCSHHEIFDQSRKNYNSAQDLLIRITIPTKDRNIALKELDNDYNINHFTLFQTEDSLIKTLGIKEFDIGGK